MRSAEASKPPVIESLSVRVTIAEISALAPDVVIPMHCTGRNFIARMRAEMPDRLIDWNTGSLHLWGIAHRDARHSADLAVGGAVADGEHLDLLDPGRRAKFDDVAHIRFHQRSRDRREPAHLAAVEIGLVDADDRDRHFGPAPGGVGDGRAEKHLVALFLLLWVDHLGALQPLGQKADAPINLVQAALAVDIVAVLRP